MRKIILLTIYVIATLSLSAQTYNQYEVDKLKAFFAQPSAIEGKNNGEALGITNLDDPGSWRLNQNNSGGIHWEENTINNKRVSYITWTPYYNSIPIAGKLDLSNFTSLTNLTCFGQALTSINITNNTALTRANAPKLK